MEKKTNNNPVITAVKGLLPYFATPAMLVYLIWTYSADRVKNEQLQFSTPQIKLKTESHVNDAVSELEHYKAVQTMDSVYNALKAYQLDTDKRRAKNDSLDQLNKTTIYQIKEELRQINNKIENENN